MNKELKGGFIPDKPSNKDFSYTKQFGAITKLPTEDFLVAEPLKIKDQKNSDMCVAYGLCAVSEDQENMELSPEWFFSQIKKAMGDWKTWGAGIKDGCKVAVKVGFLPERLETYSLGEADRDAIANWNNWPDLTKEALSQRKQAYFKADGQKDTFDSFRATLYANKSEKRSIITGVIWQNHWLGAKNGIIPKEKGSSMFGHAFKIFGQKTINKEIYLIAQLSNGESVGDKGIFYFPREVINRDFIYGGWTFKDIDPSEVKAKQWSIWQKLLWSYQELLKDIKGTINLNEWR